MSSSDDHQREVIYLPEGAVRNSVGFSLDFGNSLTKIIYRSKEDFNQGQPINEEAVKDGRGRVCMTIIPRESELKDIADVLLEKCDLKRPSGSDVKVKVKVTGVGCNLFRADLEKLLNVELEIFMEDDCYAEGFKLLMELLPEEELLYPLPVEHGAGAMADMMKGYLAGRNETCAENYSKMTNHACSIPTGSKPFLPCLLVQYGSTGIISKIDENGVRILDDTNGLAGRAFLGFASYIHGPISFEDLNSKLESTDGSTVDTLLSEIIGEGGDYGHMKDLDVRVMPFNKLITESGRQKAKPEDMTLSFLTSLVQVQGHLAHVHALANQVRRIYFTGSFINMALVRRFLFEEIESRNRIRPKCQHIDVHFLRNGAYACVIGSFMKQ